MILANQGDTATDTFTFRRSSGDAPTITGTPQFSVIDPDGTVVTAAANMTAITGTRYYWSWAIGAAQAIGVYSVIATGTFDGLTVEVEIAQVQVRAIGASVDLDVSGMPSVADCALFGYTVPEWAIIRAWTRIKSYTRQTITAASATVTLEHPYRLPRRPVRSITSITDEDGDAIDSDDYNLRGSFIEFDSQTDHVIVTYEYGYATLPDDLVELVASVAYRIATAPDGLAQGVRSEGAGGESISYGMDAYRGTTSLTSDEEKVLDRLFGLKIPTSRAIDPP